MTAATFLPNAGTLLGLMAIVSLVEAVAPFRAGGPWRRAHRAANLGLTALTLLLNFLLGAAVLGVTARLAEAGGLLEGVGLPAAVLVGIGVVVLDLSAYGIHRLMHRIGWMWRYHRVHHSDPFVDVTTAYRQHPVEGMLRFAFTMVPAWAVGVSPESVAVYRLLSASNALLEHANVRLWQPLDAALSWAVVTPNMHKVHHSRTRAETDSNYGNLLAFYDRLFRTFSPTSRAAEVTYGLDGWDVPAAQSLGALLRSPWAGAPNPASPLPDAPRHAPPV